MWFHSVQASIRTRHLLSIQRAAPRHDCAAGPVRPSWRQQNFKNAAIALAQTSAVRAFLSGLDHGVGVANGTRLPCCLWCSPAPARWQSISFFNTARAQGSKRSQKKDGSCGPPHPSNQGSRSLTPRPSSSPMLLGRRRSIATCPARLTRLGGALTLREVRLALSDLDDITVRIADVAARLAVLVLRLRDERGSSTSP